MKSNPWKHPVWVGNAVIYEVNVRQYTAEGTFNAFAKHLDRIKSLGVDILWFMPIHPIGEIKRKGSLGSYYSVKDYKDINPEFGTKDDFRNLVKQIHDAGMYVLIDWVANHTAWDNVWVTEHPEWYIQNDKGEVLPPFDWEDVADLNYDNSQLREAMCDALEYWVEEFGIDGYRCDVADLVPTDFWNNARTRLEKIKPVFMLAEAENVSLNEHAFNMSYATSFHKKLNAVAAGHTGAYELVSFFHNVHKNYRANTLMMQFISNHDENSWNGSEFERMNGGVKAFAALCFLVPGMPLIYSGQEASLDKRLAFFDKDEINWDNLNLMPFYNSLIKLKKSNVALWNGDWGGDLVWINTSEDKKIFAFIREKADNKVFVILNLSGNSTEFVVKGYQHKGKYSEYFLDYEINFHGNDTIVLAPWEYKVFIAL